MNKTAKKNIIGNKYGTLTVQYELKDRNKHGHIMYHVICDCGKEKDVLGSSMRSGSSLSCNKCYLLTGSHGMYKERVYRIWVSMRSRCSTESININEKYAGRGISVCKRWEIFENFFKDMGYPKKDQSIERLNVNGNYEPSNCIWADAKVQANNRTNNKQIEINGIKKNISQWCDEYSIPTSTFSNRIKRGWTGIKLISPIRSKHRSVNGQFIKN